MLEDTLNKNVRDWGYYIDIFRSVAMVMKKIVVYPNHKLSLQYHEKRCEHWCVESGSGKMIFNDIESVLLPSNYIYIPKGVIHRIINDGPCNLVVYETQIGICDENDIIRLKDDYGRASV